MLHKRAANPDEYFMLAIDIYVDNGNDKLKLLALDEDGIAQLGLVLKVKGTYINCCRGVVRSLTIYETNLIGYLLLIPIQSVFRERLQGEC